MPSDYTSYQWRKLMKASLEEYNHTPLATIYADLAFHETELDVKKYINNNTSQSNA